MGTRERKTWKEANREVGEKAPISPGCSVPPPKPDPIIGAAREGVLLGTRWGTTRVDAWSLPRRRSVAATLLPIEAQAVARCLRRKKKSAVCRGLESRERVGLAAATSSGRWFCAQSEEKESSFISFQKSSLSLFALNSYDHRYYSTLSMVRILLFKPRFPKASRLLGTIQVQ